MKLLLYCPKTKPYLYFANNLYKPINGKIVIECDYEIEEIIPEDWNSNIQDWYSKTLLKKSCLDALDLKNYLKDKNGKAIYIKNLHIFDEPIALDKVDKRKWIKNEDMYENEVCDSCMDFRIDACKNCSNHYEWLSVSKAPQNMMIVWHNCVKKVLISVHPKLLCEIINGKCTVIVKKKVLKEMIENYIVR